MTRRALTLTAMIAGALVVGACSSTDDANAVGVTATNDECTVERTTLPAGKSTFAVTNEGDDVTEVYVYAEGDEVKGEVENIGPGTKRSFTVDLTAGEYEVACKPGMKGDGIRTTIEVTGSGGTATPEPTETTEVGAVDYEFSGIDGNTYAAGDTVEFVMRNDAPEEQHELEVFGPNGTALGEVGPTDPGESGRVVLTLPEAGTYRVVCGIDDHEDQGMTATFTVE